MACGVPVVSSNTTAIPEIIGDAGILIDPNNPLEIAESIGELLGDPDLQRELISLGYAQAAKWTWQSAAQLYLDAVDEFTFL
ncbi:hypothetical protein PMSM_06135 [Paenibacillus macquariensis subsp. macquariensis]|uniref:Glycosyl transferases group 1 n=2 Tax=Paenibacillus macquariensis TaxID=948756 RepID=A0ABY1JQW5_9BACL|nr:hypothetical protein PMSM_06135 [Paenibacillus macquariensis subsp. macquariensis]SIQ62794.1 Glycosyl transferases group 1 [Paenibacillus macquariensis]